MRRALLLTALMTGIAFAQSTEDRIRELEERIRELQREIQKLKEEQRETEVLKDEIRKLRLEIAMPTLEMRSYYGLGPAASKALFNPKGVSIGGYGEIHFVHDPDSRPRNEVDAKRLILYFGYAFNEKLKLNSEIEWEHAFVEGGEKSGEINVEFAFLDYNVNEKLGLRGGLLLVPVGIINEYHEPPTFPTVDRPFLERNIIPTTWRELGFGMYGKWGALEYRAYLLNGMRANEEAGENVEKGELLKGFRQKGFKAASDQIAFVGRLDYLLPYNLKVGASVYTGGVQDEKGHKLGTLSLLSPHLWWQYAGFDVRFVGVYGTVSGAKKISEVITANPLCNLDPSQCVSFPKKFYGFYTQVAYDIFRLLKIDGQELYLFGMYENYNTHADVPQGFAKPDGHKVQVLNFGLSYKPHPLIALKADYAKVLYSPNKEDKDLYRAALTWMF